MIIQLHAKLEGGKPGVDCDRLTNSTFGCRRWPTRVAAKIGFRGACWPSAHPPGLGTAGRLGKIATRYIIRKPWRLVNGSEKPSSSSSSGAQMLHRSQPGLQIARAGVSQSRFLRSFYQFSTISSVVPPYPGNRDGGRTPSSQSIEKRSNKFCLSSYKHWRH